MKSIHTSILFALLILSVFSSCASSRAVYSSPTIDNSEKYSLAERTEQLEEKQTNPILYPESPKTSKKERKIIYTGNVHLTSLQTDSTNSQLKKITEKYQGYISYSSTDETIIRVKSNHFEAALAEVEKLGKVKRKHISGNDVTREYFDTKIRLENALKTRKRYLELLKMAQNVEEAILVERELTRITEQIELFKGRLNQIDNLDTYATISVSFKEKAKLGILGYVGVGLYKTVKWFFVRG